MWAWSCSFTKHELHLRVTAKCCKSFFLALKTRFTPLQSFSCACKLYLRLQSYVHFHKSYHTHANLLGVKLPSYSSLLCNSVHRRQSSKQIIWISELSTREQLLSDHSNLRRKRWSNLRTNFTGSFKIISLFMNQTLLLRPRAHYIHYKE